jgi:hypothetical protein
VTHQGEVARVYGYTSFASAEAELVKVGGCAGVDDRDMARNDVTDRLVPDRKGASDV